jgi:hypothetical protein
MTNPENPTMAAVSGGKRDRNSDDTDQTTNSPNSKDSKLLCANDKVAIGKKKGEETVEIAQKNDFVESKGRSDGARYHLHFLARLFFARSLDKRRS